MDWLTVKEASRIIGKHPDTIRAFYRKHKSEIKKDKNGRILIPKSLIEQEYGAKGDTPKASKKTETDENHKIIQLLSKQIEKLETENAELKKVNQRNTEKLLEIVQQVNMMNGYVLRLEAENTERERAEKAKTKKHWWNSKH